MTSYVNFISQCFVRPESDIEQSNQHQYNYLNPIDLSLLSVENIQYGFIFDERSSQFPHSSASYIEDLKLSLSRALVPFYPLAGQFVTAKSETEHSSTIFIDCNKGPGAKLIHAVASSLAIEDVVSRNNDVPKFVQSFFDLGERSINHDGHNRPLLSIQITELSNSVFIGFSINHCVADGTSFKHFLTTLSSYFSAMKTSSSFISNPPIYNYRPESIPLATKLPYLEPHEFIIQANEVELRERVFNFSAKSVATLKANVNADEAVESAISSYQALTALVWRSITRARNLPSTRDTSCILVANLRPRFNPPLSHEYFGNFVVPARGFAQVGELMANGISWAAKLLHKAVVELDDKAAHVAFSGKPIMLSPRLLSCGPNPVVMGGSPRFDMYGLEFGLGRAAGIRTGYGHKADGWARAFMGSEGEGSVELQICLVPESMNALLSDQEFLNFVSV